MKRRPLIQSSATDNANGRKLNSRLNAGRTDAIGTAKVFVCWSGMRSLRVAKVFRAFLVQVIPALEGGIFISTSLDKGVRWFEEIFRQLEAAQAGILCLTAENLASPWLHFEAGALAKGLHNNPSPKLHRHSAPLRNRIFTYLHGAPSSTLTGPLAQYQSTTTTREDTWNMVKALVGILFPPNEINASALSAAFEKAWLGFDEELKGIAVPIIDLLPDFEGWFRRKTFEEPLQQCTDQNWTARYDGVRQTHDRLSEHIGSVRQACPRYQIDLL